MKKRVKQWLSKLTLAQKARLVSGADWWRLVSYEKMGIPSIMVSDGPHGLRTQKQNPQPFGPDDSIPATCFPSGATLASSWDRKVLATVGKALGDEAKAEGVSVVLGPAVNIKRSPLCGRNFEYYSEDPFLATQCATAYIKGMQDEGVGTSLKHFCANNQEDHRLTIDEHIDERTLREIYLSAFETAVKEAKPWTIMASYNKINGSYACEHPYTLRHVLRDEWKYRGLVMSDWGATNDRVAGLKNGLDLEMPGNNGLNDKKIIQAVKKGTLPLETLDEAVAHVLELIYAGAKHLDPKATCDLSSHHLLAAEIAKECIVLLKNQQEILPLGSDETVLVVGPFARTPRYQGGGSSHVHPTQIEAALPCMEKLGKITFTEGFSVDSDAEDPAAVAKALELAATHQKVVVFAGMPDAYESEGYDRTHMQLPPNQNALITALAKVNPHLVVVLSNGSPVEMPWVGQAEGIVEGYLGGQASGKAMADILYGVDNPSGHLAETFPLRLEDTPAYLNFPGAQGEVDYREGVFVGYRYYDARKMPVLFPFGHGLSYTTFRLTDLRVDKSAIQDTGSVTVTVDVTNIGARCGKCVVQLYVQDTSNEVIRPVRELKEFAKVELQPGERKTVSFTLGYRSFAYFEPRIEDWRVPTGEYVIHVGFSSRDLPLSAKVRVASTRPVPKVFSLNTPMDEIMNHPLGRKLVMDRLSHSPLAAAGTDKMVAQMMTTMPLRAVVDFSQGLISEKDALALVAALNKAEKT